MSQIEGITKGHLDKNLHAEAFKNLQKKVNNSNEELLKLLESLDGINLTEDQKGIVILLFLMTYTCDSECKMKRKSVATNMNNAMDKTEDILERLNNLMEHGIP